MSQRPVQFLHTYVAQELGCQILRGDLKPGDTLPDIETLCNAYDVSRTVLREAIKMLTAKGMVMSQPRVGVTVRARSHWELLDTGVMRWRISNGLEQQLIYDILEMRRIIEPGAVEMCAAQASDQVINKLHLLYKRLEKASADEVDNFILADAQFHTGIILAANNELLNQMVQMIEISIITVASLTAHVPDGRERAMPAHRAVMEACLRRDARAANLLMRDLVDETVKQIDLLFNQTTVDTVQLMQEVTGDVQCLLDVVSSRRESDLGEALVSLG